MGSSGIKDRLKDIKHELSNQKESAQQKNNKENKKNHQIKQTKQQKKTPSQNRKSNPNKMKTTTTKKQILKKQTKPSKLNENPHYGDQVANIKTKTLEKIKKTKIRKDNKVK